MGEPFRPSRTTFWQVIRIGRPVVAQSVAQPLPVQETLSSPVPWQLAACLAAIAPRGDLIPDGDVERLLPRLLELTRGSDWPGPSRRINMEAWKAIASITFQLPEDGATDVLDKLEPLIQREPGHGRQEDDSLVDILIRLYRSKPRLRQRVGACLLRLLGRKELALSVGTWAQLRSFASNAFGTDRELRDRMAQIATDGSPLVLEMLAFAHDRHAAVLDEATRRANRILDMDPEPHQQSWALFSNLDVAAVFVALLPLDRQEAVTRHLVTIAAQPKYPEEYRASALGGVSNLAHGLPSHFREELFDTVFRLTDPSLPVSDIDQFTRGSQHLLSRFRFNFGAGMLPQSAIVCGARLATRQEHAQQIVSLASDLFFKGDDGEIATACVALVNLDDALRPRFDVRQLVEHPSAHVRRMAIAMWAKVPRSLPDVGVILVHDPDTSVRLRVAASLEEVAKHAPEQRDTLRDILLTDRSAVVRLHALVA